MPTHNGSVASEHARSEPNASHRAGKISLLSMVMLLVSTLDLTKCKPSCRQNKPILHGSAASEPARSEPKTIYHADKMVIPWMFTFLYVAVIPLKGV